MFLEKVSKTRDKFCEMLKDNEFVEFVRENDKDLLDIKQGCCCCFYFTSLFFLINNLASNLLVFSEKLSKASDENKNETEISRIQFCIENRAELPETLFQQLVVQAKNNVLSFFTSFFTGYFCN